MDKEKEVNGKPIELPRRTRKLPPKTIMSSTPTTLNDQVEKSYVLGKGKVFMNGKEIGTTGSPPEIRTVDAFPGKTDELRVIKRKGSVSEGTVVASIEKEFKIPKKVSVDVMSDWMESMYILMGTMLHKLGQKGIELSARDLEKFDQTRSLKYHKSPNGKLSYQVVKKPKGEAE